MHIFPFNKYTSEIMYNQFTKWQECYNTAQQAIINKAWYGTHNVNKKEKKKDLFKQY